MVKGCFNWSGAKHLYQNSKGQLGCRSIALDLGQLGCRSIALDLGQLGSRSIALTAKWTGVNKDIHFCAPPSKQIIYKHCKLCVNKSWECCVH